MSKYKGKDVKVGDVIEVPIKYSVVAIGGGHISASASVNPPATVNVDDEAPEVELGPDGKPLPKVEAKPLVVKLPKYTPRK